MKKIKAVILILIAALIPLAAFADEPEAMANLQVLLDRVNQEDFKLAGDWGEGWWVWTMNPQNTNQVDRVFYAGNDYILVAAGDSRVADVDIRVYDENWNLIYSDNDSSAIALAGFSPRWDGVFHVRVTYYSGRSPGSLGFFVAYRKR